MKYFLLILSLTFFTACDTNKDNEAIEIATQFIRKNYIPLYKHYDELKTCNTPKVYYMSDKTQVNQFINELDKIRFDFLESIEKINFTKEDYKLILIEDRMFETRLDALHKLNTGEGFYEVTVCYLIEGDQKYFNIIVNNEMEVINKPVDMEEINKVVDSFN